MKDVVTAKFGTETINDTPIFPDLKRAMGHTLQLVVVAELLAILLAVGIGVFSVLRQYSVFDYTATTASFVGLAIPVFWLALMLQVLFVNIYLWFHVRIFYVANLSGVDPGPASTSPSTVRSTSVCRSWCSWWPASRSTRASCAPRCLRSSTADYVRTARAKGLEERRVTMKHAFRNALIPLVTIVALNFGALLGGAVVTETIFALDGMGLYFITKLNAGDPYPVMAFLMVTAVFVIIFNLLADLAYGFLDPRVRLD